MATPITAKLEVTVTIDPDEYDNMQQLGMTDKEIQRQIARAITLTDHRRPVDDIDSVMFLKYGET